MTGRFSHFVGRKSTHGSLMAPLRRASSNVNTPYIAIAPWAKLMTPDPRYTTTRPAPSVA